MAWIESHQGLRDNPKTRKLARNLGLSVPAVIGHLQCLWWWAIDYGQDGELSKYDSEDIADAMMWDGDPKDLLAALAKAGFLDSGEQGLRIHDWYEYAGRLLEQRKTRSESKQRQYALYSNLRLTKAVKSRDGDTCQYCGKTVNWNDRRGSDGGTYDHIDPDGATAIDNLAVSCRSCDSKKGERTPEQAGMTFIFGGYTLNQGNNTPDNRRVIVDSMRINADSMQEKSTITVPNSTEPKDIPPLPPLGSPRHV